MTNKAPQYFAQNGYQNPSAPTDNPWTYAYDFAKGETFFSYFQKRPEVGMRSGGLMEAVAGGKPMWAEYYQVQERLKITTSDDEVLVVDIGGGKGHDIAGL